jgi:uncharacterized protein YfaS (alpha-2-macroglobulin family)
LNVPVAVRVPSALRWIAVLSVLIIGAAEQPARATEVPMSEVQGQREAEQLFAKGAFQRAHDAYAAIEVKTLAARDAAWIHFRLLDTQWRAEAGSSHRDNTKLQAAREKLDQLVAKATRQEDHTRVWAEAQESLGDFYWERPEERNWWQAWQHYQLALDWWAGANVDHELARKRYLDIIWRSARPGGADSSYSYGDYGNYLPADVLENALSLAVNADDKARAHFFLAMALKNQGDEEQAQRVPEEFEAALSGGKKIEFYDVALYHYASFLEQQGRARQTPDGNWIREPDYAGALAIYRRLLKEYRPGESRFYDPAKSQSEAIVQPQLSVAVSNIFLPGSQLPWALSYRNLPSIDFELRSLDLTKDLAFEDNSSSGDWLTRLAPKGKVIKRWSKTDLDKGDYKPASSSEMLDSLPPGAYLLTASGGKDREGKTLVEHALVLVTDTTLVVKSAPGQTVVWTTDAITGVPKAHARTTLWERVYGGSKGWHWNHRTLAADANGLALFPRDQPEQDSSSAELFAASSSGDSQAFSVGGAPSRLDASHSWKITAITDRPAYRPGDEASWKILARQLVGSSYSTPAGETLLYEIHDPQGAKISNGSVKLNAFGSASGSLLLTEKMPLGAYQITFKAGGNEVGSAQLLRLEEYKLPEFTVAVKTPEEGGRKKTFLLGDKVTADIQVDSYFGGPVADAEVQILIYQTPSWISWRPERAFPWFYGDLEPQHPNWYGGGQVVKQQQMKTDATGKASITFATPRGAQQDMEYRIEARVTDASRREVTGSGTVKVSRQRFQVYLNPTHSIYRPKEKVTVDVKTLDANSQPLSATGTVSVTRERWWEIWLDPRGAEIKGDALEKLRRETPDFAQKGYRFKFRGYQHDAIASHALTTDANGAAQYTFAADTQGYYLVHWSSIEIGRNPIRADASIWVATEASSDLGYRSGGLEILLDQDTIQPETSAPVMLHTASSNRWVLFTVTAADLERVEVVHVEGTVKLLTLHVDDGFTPNIFLGASMVQDQNLLEVQKQVIVPPTRHFLSVSVEPDKKEYQSREAGTWSVTTRDHSGKPVAAEVSLGIVDESVYAIESDLAPDPREFFFGTKRGNPLQTRTTFNEKSYAKVVPAPPTVLTPGEAGQPADDQSFGQNAPAMMDAEMSAGPRAHASGMARTSRAAPAPVMLSKSVASSKEARDAAPEMPPPAPPPGGAAGGGGEPAVVVRSDFRATAFWKTDVITDSNGHAQVSLSYPDSLTTWRATARAATSGSSFGIERGAAKTRLPLLVRLQAPRFFVVGDKPLISAVVNNNTDAELKVSVELAAEGLEIKSQTVSLQVPANGSARADWRAQARKAGAAKLKVTARGGGFADAMEKPFPVYEHGIDKLVAKSGKVRGEGVRVQLDLPKERRPGSTEMTVQVAPSIAVTMLDALPYLIDYPYGCTEQTMSRFMPAVLVSNALSGLGLDPKEISARVFGGIELASADKTHPTGKKELRDLPLMVKEGLARLYDFQHADGGWGWWKEGASDRYMSAYVLWGLSLARDAGVEVKANVLARASEYVNVQLVNEELNPDRQAWLLHAMSATRAKAKSKPGEFEKKAFDHLWKQHAKLNAYSRALLALAAHNYGMQEQASTLAQNLENGVERDDAPDTSIVQEGAQTGDASAMATAHWGKNGFWWRWSDSPVETTSFALMALSAIDPKSVLVEQSMSWLVKNRRGAQWSNTKDTAIAVLALTRYLQTSKELSGDLEFALTVNGKEVARQKIGKEQLLSAPSQFVIDPALLQESNKLELKKLRGEGPLYFSAQARFFSLEEPITPAGNELFVRRSYYKKVGRKTLLKGTVYDSVPLEDGGKVETGERIEVVVAIEAKNDYEYLLFEDLKPAGFEAVEVKSGANVVARAIKQSSYERNYGKLEKDAHASGLGASTDSIDYTGAQHGIYQELRDRKIALFADKLEQGIWEIRYELRAEVPGEFHGLPVIGQAMYVPEVRANGREVRVEVLDKK